MKLWYTNKLSFTSYTTLTRHSCARWNFHVYVMSRVQCTMYKIIATSIECTTALQANNMRVTRASINESVPCIDKLMSGSPLRVKKLQNSELEGFLLQVNLQHKTLISKAVYLSELCIPKGLLTKINLQH